MKARPRTGSEELKARHHIAINEADEVRLAKIYTILLAARQLPREKRHRARRRWPQRRTPGA